MRVSYVIISRNRRERLLKTLAHLPSVTPIPASNWETFVVDNASTDGTAAAVRRAFPAARLIELPENEGMPARNHAFKLARGKYIVLLDDDSYPTGDAIPNALAHLARYHKTAAVVARVVLPSGGLEAPAFPSVTLGGASVIRKSVIDQIGGFAPEFFRQAEEYDFSFRIWQAGYRIERFEDVVFRHDKDESGRSSALNHKMDIRNNLILVERYLPRELRRAYRADWIRRYMAFAMHEGHRDAARLGLMEARIWGRREASVGRKVLSPAVIEELFQLDSQAKAVAEWKTRHQVKNVVIADFSKNLYSTWKACRSAGLTSSAIADNRAAFAGSQYRRTPILPDEQALGPKVDGIVVSTINPAQIDTRIAQLRRTFAGPVLRLWEPRFLKPQTKAAA